MAYQAMMPTGIVNPISPGSVTWMCPVTEMPTGIVNPINPVMERSDLAGIQETHTPDDVAGRHRQSD